MNYQQMMQSYFSEGDQLGMELAADEDPEAMEADRLLVENPEALEEDMRKSLTDLLYRRMRAQRNASEEMQAKALG